MDTPYRSKSRDTLCKSYNRDCRTYTTDDFTQNADGGYTLNAGVPYLKGSNRENVKPGDAKYRPTAGEVDADGNPVWGTNDRTVIGNAAPNYWPVSG